MANQSEPNDASSRPGGPAENASTQDLYRQMFVAHGSTQPSTRDLYRQMFATHGVPTPRPAVQRPPGMVTLESNTPPAQTSTQGLYREMFATHGIPTPHPAVQQPEGIVDFESSGRAEASTEGLYRQMFVSHGFPTPITFHGSTPPAQASVSDLYQQMFAAHGSSTSTVQPAVQPRHRQVSSSRTGGRSRRVPSRGAAATKDGRVKKER